MTSPQSPVLPPPAPPQQQYPPRQMPPWPPQQYPPGPPQFPPQYPYRPGPPPKGHTLRNVLIALAGVLVLLLAIGVGASIGEGGSKAPAPKAHSSAPVTVPSHPATTHPPTQTPRERLMHWWNNGGKAHNLAVMGALTAYSDAAIAMSSDPTSPSKADAMDSAAARLISAARAYKADLPPGGVVPGLRKHISNAMTAMMSAGEDMRTALTYVRSGDYSTATTYVRSASEHIKRGATEIKQATKSITSFGGFSAGGFPATRPVI